MRYQGRVVDQASYRLTHRNWYRYPVTQLREFIKHRLQEYVNSHLASPWLLALMIGEREMIPAHDWEVLRITGTNHLMAIAGLHVGMLAHFLRQISFLLWRRSKSLLYLMPACEASLCVGLLGGLSYAMLSSFLLPTQRAAIMMMVAVVMNLKRYRYSIWNPWSCALIYVLCLNPTSILTDSFWLSFVTLALIIYGMSSRLVMENVWWKWGRVQWVIAIGLIPVTLLWYQECSLSSLITNTITIPWLEFIILPIVFVAELFLMIDLDLATPFLFFANIQIAWLWHFLEKMANLPLASIHFAIPSEGLFVVMMVGILLLLLPAGMPGRWFGVIWLVPVLCQIPPLIKPGEFNLSILDVGQGLSVVVQTQHHTLLYDTGPGFDDGFNAGNEVIMPFLYFNHINTLDMVIVSHGDNDGMVQIR